MLSISDSVNYTTARNQLASLLDRITDNKEIIIINRRNKPDVALIAKEELSSLLETLYLLRSPAKALKSSWALAGERNRYSVSKRLDNSSLAIKGTSGLLRRLIIIIS